MDKSSTKNITGTAVNPDEKGRCEFGSAVQSPGFA
jgi:hypothetical protein